jgi:hypothetical protein
MGVADGSADELTVRVDADGSVAVDVGTRFVVVDAHELERIIDRLGADGGSIRLIGGAGRADDGDEPPERESDPAMGAAGFVLVLAHRHGVHVTSES